MIFYLIYLSSATHLYTKNDLSDILSKSRINNSNRDVTGLLLYHEGSILQILEGNEETVTSLYDKIEQDGRHHSIIKMVTGRIEERNFSEWSMGFRTVSDEEWNEMSGYFRLDSKEILSRLVKTNRKVDTMVNSYMSVNFRG